MTLWIGAAMVLVCELLLAVDVLGRGGVVIGHGGQTAAMLPRPTTLLGETARWAARNMTVLCWIGDLFFFEGLLTGWARRRGEAQWAAIRVRPNRFVLIYLTSVPVWCFFDWVNFYFLDAWRYHGLPADVLQRMTGYFLAFAAISPGMFLAAQVYQMAGVRRLRTTDDTFGRRMSWLLEIGPPILIAAATLVLSTMRHDRLGDERSIAISAGMLILPGVLAWVMTRSRDVLAVAIGAGFVGWTFYARAPIGNLTLWVGLIYLLDPINLRTGGPSLLGDWRAGRYGRTAALMLGGATCGLLWEFWNYWAIAKWTYHLPFLGAMQGYRYFEMPLLGFMGFLPFACECWVMANVILLALQPGRARLAERLPDNEAIL